MSDSRKYVIYDARACGGQGTDQARLCDVADSNTEARRCHQGIYGAVACYSYRVNGKKLVDERWEWDWFPKETRSQ
ncbi:MAG: hypothetical protein L0Z50_20945 [Verrucomicrobiales bacterium]|nr:hypothetical protein [Verrucomicrobiales bacterium]